jgi:uncharacterized protein (DUF2147 family)
MILRSCSLGSAVTAPSFAFAILLSGSAHAAAQSDPTGEWMVEKGYATIRIVDCNGQYWGVVASEQTPGVDKNNPDPRLRTRPTLGMPVLKGMKPSKPNEWSGEIYNSQDGRTYSANISLLGQDTLKVQGCVMGFLCGGENWSRVAPEKTGAAPPPASKPAATSGAKPAGPAKPANTGRPSASAQAEASPQTQPAEEICSGLLGLPGSAHERRLK